VYQCGRWFGGRKEGARKVGVSSQLQDIKLCRLSKVSGSQVDCQERWTEVCDYNQIVDV